MSHYILALYDNKHDKKWYITPKRFVIEENTDNIVRGIFLRDIWFNYDIGNGNFKNDIHIILIETTNPSNYVLDDINRNTINNQHEPSILDKPKNTAANSYYFILEKNIINNYAKTLLQQNNSNLSKKLTIRNKENDSEVFLSFDFYNYNNEIVLMTLPKFEI
tara:strand:+ start:27138 stop:27626 length:489 start_codon:yes stop_codon:yes gene_type:complete